jgi:hypothetical protein
MSGTEIGLLVGAGAVVYPVTVGLAARLWVRLLGWDIAHDDGWRDKKDRPCGSEFEQGDSLRGGVCPGCRHRFDVWWLGAFWPVTAPGYAVGRTAYRTLRLISNAVLAVGPQAYTGDD